MSFDKHSNFNKQANFTEVKFGENKPVLEVELNEMQQIQNEARADIVRDSIPSGFITLGGIDYDYCKNNSNQIKLKSESIAYVNGYRITIPANTIIEIGESDKVREDLVFLEVWKEVVTDTNELKEYGGEDNEVINNPIKDSRYPVATSQRVQLKYRIRHVADIDFNTYVCDGFTKEASSVSGFTHNNQQVLAIGGLSDETSLGESHRRFFNYKQRSHYKNINNGKNVPFEGSTDCGLYVAGNERDKTQFNTIDGYVYAIPMFRLLRKPNVGLASPFEYKKIHNQLDPKKFAHLVGQENVEKVHSVNVKGKTYNNLVKVANSTRINQNTEVNISLEPYTKYIAFGDFSHSDNPNTFALLCISTVYAPNGRLYGSGDDLFQDTVSGGLGKEIRANKTLNYLIFDSESYNYCHVRSGGGAGGMFSDLMLFKYEDEMEELTLEYFKGVQSLGESTNNSITVENNLVEEGTYVHELQNHILPTHPEVTHVTWGEDVVIPPEVEIELKNGEEVIQTITQLPARLETTGEEKLHVKTMKGQTLVNLSGQLTHHEKWVEIGDDLALNSQSDNAQPQINVELIYKLKKDTIYTVVINMKSYETGYPHIGFMDESNRQLASDKEWTPSTTGVLKTKFTTSSTVEAARLRIIPRSGIDNIYTINKNIIILEGDYTNVDIPYFEGMQSVKMPILHTVGKNLATVSSVRLEGIRSNSGGHPKNIIMKNIPVEEGKTYTISGIGTKSENMNYISLTRYEHQTPTNSNNHTELWNEVGRDNADTTFTIPKGIKYVSFTFGNCTYNNNGEDGWLQWDNIQLEEGSTSTPCEPYKSNILRTPSDLELRGVGDVKDTLNYLTGEVTERIGEITLDGSEDENWKILGLSGSGLSIGFYISINNKKNVDVKCDKLPLTHYDDIVGIKQGGSESIIQIRMTTEYLTSLDLNSFKIWLAQNPLTIQYKLATESIKTVDVTEDDYAGKSKVTYQLAEPLNNIPNGAYDEIKGDKVIKRTNKIYLDGTETWSSFRDETNTTHRISLPMEDGKPSSVCMSSHYEYGTGSTVEKVKIYMTVNANLSITVLKSDFPTVDSFKTWLSNNRPMVIYELANPIEIPLKEVSPLDVDFSLNRQFKRGYENYLKELPNGVKDVVENGKVKRNVKHLVVNGTENWTTLSTDGDTVRAFMMLSGAKPLAPTFNSYDFTHGTAQTDMNILGVDQNGNLVIGILKTLLTSPDVQGIKEYLSRKNLHVIYELQTPTTEELTEENSRYVPYMPLNSYVGSLYVADGINRTKFLTDFSPSEYEVQTYHRYFSNEFNMFEDITLKKSPYGHKTYLEEVDGKYVEKFIAGLEKHEIEDLRHKVSLTGFDYSQLLQDSFLKLIKGELS